MCSSIFKIDICIKFSSIIIVIKESITQVTLFVKESILPLELHTQNKFLRIKWLTYILCSFLYPSMFYAGCLYIHIKEMLIKSWLFCFCFLMFRIANSIQYLSQLSSQDNFLSFALPLPAIQVVINSLLHNHVHVYMFQYISKYLPSVASFPHILG